MATLYDRRWLAEDGRHCTRCGADVHPPDPPHLCKDLADRLARQTKAMGLVRSALARHGIEADDDAISEVVRALSGRDLGVD